MRMVFGVLSLLVVLAIVGSLARTQLHALNGGVATRASTASRQANVDVPAPGGRDGVTAGLPGGMAGAEAADPSGLTVPQRSQNIQQQFRDDTARALQQGMDRNARAPQ